MRPFKNITKFLLFLFVFVAISSFTYTPDPVSSYRLLFIGADSTDYYAYLINHSAPGSYYTYTDSIFLIRCNIKENKLVEKHLLRATTYLDRETEGKFEVEKKNITPFSVEKYLDKRNIDYALADDSFQDLKFGTHEQGVFAYINTKKALFLDEKCLSNAQYIWIHAGLIDQALINNFSKAKIMEWFYKNDQYFFIVQNEYEMGSYQFVVCLNNDKIRELLEPLSK